MNMSVKKRDFIDRERLDQEGGQPDGRSFSCEMYHGMVHVFLEA